MMSLVQFLDLYYEMLSHITPGSILLPDKEDDTETGATVKAFITYEDGSELEVEEFAPWAASLLGNPAASEEDLVDLANYVLDIAEDIASVDIDGDTITSGSGHYRDGWDSVSTDPEETA